MFKNKLISLVLLLSSFSLLQAEPIQESIKCGEIKGNFSANNEGMSYNENQKLVVGNKTLKFEDSQYLYDLQCVNYKGVKHLMLGVTMGNSYEGVKLINTKNFKVKDLRYLEARQAGLLK